jgi:large subunit ribosomal protein L4
MLKVDSYSVKGVRTGEVSLPKEFDTKPNGALISQAIRVYFDRAHMGFAKVKTRAEVDKTKKKLYKQKGTGGARHGPKSAPIFVGGGIAHGPKLVKRVLTLPSKMKKEALWISLGSKVGTKEVVVVDDLSKLTKTKDAKIFIDKIGGKKFTFVLAGDYAQAQKALRNIPEVTILPYRNLNVYHVFFGGKIVFDGKIFETGKVAKVVKVDKVKKEKESSKSSKSRKTTK